MTRSDASARGVVALVVVVALTVLATWPQALYLGSRVGSHDDPLFSVWRLAWVAHALATDSSRVFDGNIFHPADNTLTFSDAMMLEGALAAPLFWAGVSPIVVYNILLLAGFAGSGLAMFVLARHLLKVTGPALVSAAIFTMAPYRIEHFMHLELQWTMWIPLTFWAVHRTVESGSWRMGLLAGVLLWLQILSSVYYGVFLAIAVGVLVPSLLAVGTATIRRALPLLGGGVVAFALALPYALPYLETARTIGTRPIGEVATYSASWWSYLISPPQSAIWGWTARWGSPELSLFPGSVAIALAITSALHRARRMVFVYAITALTAIELSFGLNGFLYSWLFHGVDALHGLRSPSRFGIIACFAIAMLAGFGAKALIERTAVLPGIPRRAATVAAVLVLLVALDNATKGMLLTELRYEPPSTFNVYKTIRALGPGAVIELPIARLDRLPGREATYMFWSISHWHPIVNGYSGYYPNTFYETVVRTEAFPDDRSVQQLKNIGVRYIVVHREFYEESEYKDLLARIGARAELRHQGRFADPLGEAQLFVLAQ